MHEATLQNDCTSDMWHPYIRRAVYTTFFMNMFAKLHYYQRKSGSLLTDF